MNGRVYLVGAGPGDPGLVTLRAREVIELADVVVYDRLIPQVILEWARPEAELIYVGKQPGHHALCQDNINALLVAKAQEGKRVCRLKGGDPFVFGRGGEEALALVEAGVPFEVVPGITAGLAGPAYAGIPVTHRGVATSVAFVTGHEDPQRRESGLNWAGLARGIDTIVFYMGVANLPSIVGKLREFGRAPETPVALLQQATTPFQHTVIGTLEDISALAEREKIESPSLIVVGQVIELREQLAWLERKPLWGCRVLVTRTREQASLLSCLLTEAGASPVEVPVITIESLASYEVLDASLQRMAEFDWLVFTSANGVAAVMARLTALGLDVRDLKGPRIAVIGPGTAAPLKERGLRVDLVPPHYLAESLAKALIAEGVAGKRLLITRAEQAREVLPHRLAEAGAEVVVAPCYRTVPAPEAGQRIRQLLEQRRIDVVTFASSSQVTAFAESVGTSALAKLMGDIIVACIGPVTALTAEGFGLRTGVISEEHTIPGLVQALIAYWAGKRQ
ncbi:MAG: uroporphyrinogen-III C-methyltransferase [Candidatus Zipacnadales bacterium]